MLARTLNNWKMLVWSFRTELQSGWLKTIPDAEDFDDMELDDAERSVEWPRGPEEAGLEAGENGSMEGVLCGLLAGAEVAPAVNLKTAAPTRQNGLL